MKKILLIILTFFLFIPTTYAKEDNLVNIYLFHSKTCQHCKSEIKLLEKLEKEYDNIKIYKFEISDTSNKSLFNEVTDLLNVKTSGVPFTIIGGKYFSGFSEENSKKTFIATIDYYSQNGYIDKVGEYLNVPLPTYEVNSDAISIDEYIKDYGNYTFNLPIIGKVNTKNLTIPTTAVVMGLIDGLNPIAMLMLLFIIALLIGLKDQKKMLILGFTFILTSGVIHFLIMLLKFNPVNVLNGVTWIRSLVGIVIVILGSYNLTTILSKKEDKSKKKNLILSSIGVIILAIICNFISFASSTNLPIIFTKILSFTNLSKVVKIFYILVYAFFYLLDDIIIFITILTITKYKKVVNIIRNIVLIVIGILLIFIKEKI